MKDWLLGFIYAAIAFLIVLFGCKQLVLWWAYG